jgi:16S rRNA (cytosine1402-N4)-methyltransferase
MTTGRDTFSGVAGGPAGHVPVLAPKAVRLLAPRAEEVVVDATFGGGGHAQLILAAADCRVIALDRDPDAIAAGQQLVEAMQGRLQLVHARFSELETVLAEIGIPQVHGVVFDLGVSSMQLDVPGRGFSFRAAGPLDMRMGRAGADAAAVIAHASEQALREIIAALGEERHARAIARAIVAARAERPITETRQLADLIVRTVGHRPGDIHPATRTFQALRIFVNEELDELAAGLIAAERVLLGGGRLVVVSFHSLEDRIVKTFLAERSRAAAASRHLPPAASPAPTFSLLTRRPLVPDEEEITRNPRARSARLRAAMRNEALSVRPSRSAPVRLPTLAAVVRGRA